MTGFVDDVTAKKESRKMAFWSIRDGCTSWKARAKWYDQWSKKPCSAVRWMILRTRSSMRKGVLGRETEDKKCRCDREVAFAGQRK